MTVLPPELAEKLREIAERAHDDDLAQEVVELAVLEAVPLICEWQMRKDAEICRKQESEPWYGKRGKWIDGFNDAKDSCAEAIERAFKEG